MDIDVFEEKNVKLLWLGYVKNDWSTRVVIRTEPGRVQIDKDFLRSREDVQAVYGPFTASNFDEARRNLDYLMDVPF